MLRTAFLETPDYRTLIETSDRILVVGRRGTGKSALTLTLQRYWDHTDAAMVGITPEEYQIIGVRPLVELFGEKFLIIRAGMRLLWRYALIMEAAKILAPLGAFTGSTAVALLTRLQSWTPRGRSTPDRLRDLMREVLKTGATPEQRIGDLPVALDLSAMEHALASASAARGGPIVFLVDKLDEGYEPDITGVALIDGLVQAAIDIKQRIPHARPVIFLRDNIFRAVQFLDPDYSRAIEGQVLRLHWDESNLLDFTAARLKIAFNLQETSSHKIWNSCAMGELRGQQGFAECLRLTLYRPRDVLGATQGFCSRHSTHPFQICTRQWLRVGICQRAFRAEMIRMCSSLGPNAKAGTKEQAGTFSPGFGSQLEAASATASAPAAMRAGDDGSFAACHTASATSSARVTADDDCPIRAKTLCTSSAYASGPRRIRRGCAFSAKRVSGDRPGITKRTRILNC